MSEKKYILPARLRAVLHSALSFVRKTANRSRGIALRTTGAGAAQARVGLQLAQALHTPPPEALRAAAPDSPDADLGVGALELQLHLLAEHFAAQARAIEGLDADAVEPPFMLPAGRIELESVKTRVRQRRARIIARTARQITSARHVETRARRLQEHVERADSCRRRLLEVELAIARMDAALVSSQVELAEEMSRLGARERELTLCTTERALLRTGHGASGAVSILAGQRTERLRARLKQIRNHASKLHALDAPLQTGEGVPDAYALHDTIAHWSARLDALGDHLTDPNGAAATQTAPTLQLDARVLRAQLRHRVRLLEALAEVRVEETQSLHGSLPGRSETSPAPAARVNGTHIRLRLDEAERAWLLEALQAVEHEQTARLLAGVDDGRAAAEAIAQAIAAWRRCDDRLDDAARHARACGVDLATLRGALAPEIARAEAEGYELSALVRQRRRTLRTRARNAERARARLAETRERGAELEPQLRRARKSLERAYAPVVHTPLRAVADALRLLEHEVEAIGVPIAGLYAAHEHCARAIAATEAALRDLSKLQRAAVAHQERPLHEPWAFARMELDIVALSDELERWKLRHTELEHRVEAHTRALSLLELGHDDESLAALRRDVEQARRSAAAGLERALALSDRGRHS